MRGGFSGELRLSVAWVNAFFFSSPHPFCPQVEASLKELKELRQRLFERDMDRGARAGAGIA
jgi:hypothetical protein